MRQAQAHANRLLFDWRLASRAGGAHRPAQQENATGLGLRHHDTQTSSPAARFPFDDKPMPVCLRECASHPAGADAEQGKEAGGDWNRRLITVQLMDGNPRNNRVQRELSPCITSGPNGGGARELNGR